MATPIKHLETEVLVIGAGPVGIALAGDLGWRGRQCLLVDQGDGSIFQPKMDLVGIRTMEFCRRWGIVREVEDSPYDRDYPQDNVYLTTLNGYELGRQPMPSMGADRPPPESPQKRERCPQNMFDPILRKFAESQPGTRILYKHEFLSFEQDVNGVTARVIDLENNSELTIRARYLVGCDGAKSMVREQLGIAMHGKGVLTYTTNTIFRCPEFNSLHDKQPGYRYMFVGPQGTWATIVAINGRDQWRMSIIGNAQERYRYTICIYTEAESREQINAEYEDAINYRPSTRPGCRAPHVWLADGRSTLDLFGRGFVLLVLGGNAGDAGQFRDAAQQSGMPLTIFQLDEPAVRSVYEKRYVLVRPDGHVAWRGDAMPEDAEATLAAVCGHSRMINETVSL